MSGLRRRGEKGGHGRGRIELRDRGGRGGGAKRGVGGKPVYCAWRKGEWGNRRWQW